MDSINRATPSTTFFETVDDIYGAALPHYDEASTTRQICIVGVVVSYLASITCIAVGGLAVNTTGSQADFVIDDLSSSLKVVSPLALNIFVSLCTDSLGYVHSTSLRWALFREGRLEFNSNLRLLTSSKSSGANRWYSNILGAASLAVCYTASSQVFISTEAVLSASDSSFIVSQTIVNGVALLTLGVGILLQALISTACFVSQSKYILSWSSNPLNNTLVCLHSGLRRKEGLCMLPAKHSAQPSIPYMPKFCQPSAIVVDPTIRHIERLVWFLFALAIVWGVVVLAVCLHVYGIKEAPPPGLFSSSVWFYFGSNGPQNPWALLLVAVFQSLVTLANHCVELLVNRSRDEQLWRRALTRTPSSFIERNSSDGARIRYNSFKAAISSWQAITLFAFKGITHWMFGLSFYFDGQLFYMSYLAIFLLAAVTFLLAALTTVLGRKDPKGHLPAAWGHLQTLCDLVDNWGDGRTLFWGDTGTNADGSRHAGTSSRKENVSNIRGGCMYR